MSWLGCEVGPLFLSALTALFVIRKTQLEFGFALGLFVILTTVLNTHARQNPNGIWFCSRLIRIFAIK